MERKTRQPQFEAASALKSAVRFANRFGVAEITPVTESMPIGDIRKTHPMALANTFDIETAEQIALITENRRIQICPRFDPMDGMAYLVLHDSPSSASICSVKVLEFVCGTTPAKMIESLNRHSAPSM